MDKTKAATNNSDITPLTETLQSEDKITTGQFVKLIIKSCKGELGQEDDAEDEYMDYALHKGIIEDYDLVNRDNPVERRRAARIIHEALKAELAEEDEDDWSAAEDLLDLYSCHTCVMHIAQVYVKGIMSERKSKTFDLTGSITIAEAKTIAAGMLDKGKRIHKTNNRTLTSKPLQADEAFELLENDKRALLIDVRSYEEYQQGHIKGSICIPLHDLAINPYSVSIRKDTAIILYCQRGYKSSLAAMTLLEAGYSNIFTIPGIEQYSYELTQ